MAVPEGEPVREWDRQGRLLAAGFAWKEPRLWVFVCAILLVFVAFGLVLFGLMGASTRHYSVWSSSSFWSGLLLTVLTGVVWWKYRLRDAAVIFEREGRISTPHGFPGYRRRRQVEGHHSHIENIQAERSSNGWDVLMYSHRGNIVCFGTTWHYGHAHKIAKQLNLALTELRVSLSENWRDRGAVVMPSFDDDDLPTIN
jgi:hypothetical protein